MKTEDFDRLKAVCEKEGFELLNESASDNDKFFVVKKAKDIWEGVEFYELILTGEIKKITDEIKYLFVDGEYVARKLYKPSTESAYIEQLKAECFKRFGEIKEGDKMFTEFDGESFMIDYGHGFDYYKINDELRFNGWSIYRQGKWATRVKEMVHVKFGAFEASSQVEGYVEFKPYFEIQGFPSKLNGNEIAKFLASKLEEYLNKE